MFFKSYPPSLLLQPFVDEYVIICCDGINDYLRKDKYIPRPGEAMLFHFRDASRILKDGEFIQLPKIFFQRQQIHYEYIEPGHDYELLIIRFRPGAIYRLFQTSPLEFNLGFKDASQVCGDDVNLLYKHIANEPIVDNRIIHLESFLIERLSSLIHSKKTSTVHEAIDLIIECQGCISVSHLASLLSVEERSLRRYFHYQVGICVKSFIRLVKFNNIIIELLKNPTIEMMDIVVRFDYFDQTHFIHDFKKIFGETPFSFLKETNNIPKLFRQSGSLFCPIFPMAQFIHVLILHSQKNRIIN